MMLFDQSVLAPSAIAGICVLSVILGWLIPRRTYNDMVRSNELKDEQIAELHKQLGLALEVGRTIQDIMIALHRAAGTGDSTSGDER